MQMPASVGELCWGSADVVLGLSALPSAGAVCLPIPKNVMCVLEKSTAAVPMMFVLPEGK